MSLARCNSRFFNSVGKHQLCRGGLGTVMQVKGISLFLSPSPNQASSPSSSSPSGCALVGSLFQPTSLSVTQNLSLLPSPQHKHGSCSSWDAGREDKRGEGKDEGLLMWWGAEREERSIAFYVCCQREELKMPSAAAGRGGLSRVKSCSKHPGPLLGRG